MAKVEIRGIEPSLEGLPDPRAFGLSAKFMVSRKRPKEVLNYLKNNGYPMIELEKVIEQKKRVRYNGRFWSTSQRGIVDIVFHRYNVRKELLKCEAEQKKKDEINNRVVRRKGREYIEIKEKIKPIFSTIKSKYKTIDDFTLYATDLEINNALQQCQKT